MSAVAPRPGSVDASIPAWLEPLRRAAAGVGAEEIAAMLPPHDGRGRQSAVLILLSDTGDGPRVLLCERASTLRKHAGQTSFPGGAQDPTDADAVATALREAAEEVDLDPGSVDVFGVLPELYLWVTSFVVTPVLGYWRTPHPVTALDAAEVAVVANVALSELVDPANRFTVRHPQGRSGPGFTAGGLYIWGFTAMILDAILRLGGWEQPWDATLVQDLPASAVTVDVPVGLSADPAAPAGNVDP